MSETIDLANVAAVNAAKDYSMLLTNQSGALRKITYANFTRLDILTPFDLDNPPGSGFFGMFRGESSSEIPFVHNGAAIIVAVVGIITHEFVMDASGFLFYRKANNSNWSDWVQIGYQTNS